jgi:type II secretion system protein D
VLVQKRPFHRSTSGPTRGRLALCAVCALALTLPALAQDGRPSPEEARSRGGNGNGNGAAAPAPPAPPVIRQANGGPSRRELVQNDKVKLAFNDVPADETIPFIVETTGKVVVPVNVATLKTKRITLINDEFLNRAVALDLLFRAFRLNDIGVIEHDDIIIIHDLMQTPELGLIPVVDAETDIMNRTDLGNVVIKIFPVRNAQAEGIGDRIMEAFPSYARLSVDTNSNQIVVVGDIGLCQQVQRLIDQLDRNYVEAKEQTFRLAHADASEIAENIWELFEEAGTPAGQARSPQQRRQPATRQPATRPGQVAATGLPPGPRVEMRVTVNLQQNSVTVVADPMIVSRIARLIYEEWDVERPHGTSKVYTLQYTDVLQVRDTLREVLGMGGTGLTGGRAAGRTGGPAGQRADVGQIVSGIYRIEAYPDSNRLVVISRTEAAFAFLDQFIEQIDIPSTAGLPMVIELKHADAVHLSRELNALLAEAGSGEGIPAPRTGLTGRGIGEQGATGGREGGEGDLIRFPWQQRTREGRAPESPLIGQARIVPIVRQNALAVMVPVAKQQAIRELIEFFDRPGRQVMIAAVVAEVQLSDALALGLRVSSADITPRHTDYGMAGTARVDAERAIFGGLFDTAVLDLGFSVNAFLQALSRHSQVRVLQSPRIFTSDNQEAQFFDGQDVPFITSTQITDIGTITEQFDRQEVGVRINVRPRITVEGDVDMEIDLELSRVVPGTEGSRIVLDRRQTTTQVIVKNGQTIVLSGILREEESDILRKIPLLGDIPIIGALFSSTDRETTQTELLAFITPIVVDSPDENDMNFNVWERERLRRLSRPLDEHESDAQEIRRRIIDPASGMPAMPTTPQEGDEGFLPSEFDR